MSLTYGLTEACSQVATTPVASPRRDASHASARPATARRDRHYSAAASEIAPDEEILVRGPTVAPAALADDGWLHTGDLGEPRPERVAVGARAAGGDDRQRRRERRAGGGRGRCSKLTRSVLEAGVFGVQDAQWGEAVSAVVVLRREQDPDGSAGVEELRAHCARALAAYKVPKRISLVADVRCRGHRSGKLLRRELG